MEIGEEQFREGVPPGTEPFLSVNATISALVKRPNAMKILKFLMSTEETFYIKEIATILGMTDMAAWCQLTRLVKAGVVRQTKTKVDGRTHYYEVVDRELANKVLEKCKRFVGYRLARFVPYNPIRASELKKDKRFVAECQEYGLSLDEGIQVVAECPKVECKGSGENLMLSRKEQGYIPAEKQVIFKPNPKTKSKRSEELIPPTEEGEKAVEVEEISEVEEAE